MQPAFFPGPRVPSPLIPVAREARCEEDVTKDRILRVANTKSQMPAVKIQWLELRGGITQRLWAHREGEGQHGIFELLKDIYNWIKDSRSYKVQ